MCIYHKTPKMGIRVRVNNKNSCSMEFAIFDIIIGFGTPPGETETNFINIRPLQVHFMKVSTVGHQLVT